MYSCKNCIEILFKVKEFDLQCHSFQGLKILVDFLYNRLQLQVNCLGSWNYASLELNS